MNGSKDQVDALLRSLTMAEVAIAERASKTSLTALEDPTIPATPLIGALFWVAEKRTNPTLTYQQHMDTATLADIGGDDDDDGDEDDDLDPSQPDPT